MSKILVMVKKSRKFFLAEYHFFVERLISIARSLEAQRFKNKEKYLHA